MDLNLVADAEPDHVSRGQPCVRCEKGSAQETLWSDSGLSPKREGEDQPFATSHQGKDGEGQPLAVLSKTPERELWRHWQPPNLLQDDMALAFGQVDDRCAPTDAEVQWALAQCGDPGDNTWDRLDPALVKAGKRVEMARFRKMGATSMWIGGGGVMDTLMEQGCKGQMGPDK